MSIDRSLRTGGRLVQHRSVLTRVERIMKMREDGQLDEDGNPLGLPKMVCVKPTSHKKPKADDAAEDEAEAITEES